MAKSSKLSPYKIILQKCLGVRSGETVLIITDKKKKPIANSLLEEAKEVAKEVGLIEIEERKFDGEEPPEYVSAAMKKCNVAFLVTSKSLTSSNARRQASEIGVRVASLPGVTDQSLTRAILTDYDYIDKLNKKIMELLLRTETVTVQTSKGTSIKFKVDANRPLVNDNGLFQGEGAFGNLPAGEVHFAPIESTIEGTIIVDGSTLDEFVDKPIKLEVKAGHVENVTGNKTAKKLSDVLTPFGKEAFNVGEFGIGTNPKAKLTGSKLEDNKVIGTCHFGLGNNLASGGKVYAKVHTDCVLRNPTISFDKKKIMLNGKFLLGKV